MCQVSRRSVFGAAGALGVAGAAGIAAGRITAPETVAGTPRTDDGVIGRTYSPYGEHQAGIFTPKTQVSDLVAFDLLPQTDKAALGRLLRTWTGDVVALTEGRPAAGDFAPDMAQPGVSFTALIGFGSGVFELDGLQAKRPAGFQEIPPMEHDKLDERWNGGDLLVWVSADDATSVSHAVRRFVTDAAPFATRRWTQRGFWRSVDQSGTPVTGRNLFGQIDGSANPRDDVLMDTVISHDDWLSGGTQLVVRRIEMDLAGWDEAVRDRQEASVGRRLSDGAPLTGGDELDDIDLEAESDGEPIIALDAHARRSHPDHNSGRRMMRRGLNYTHDEWIDGEPVETSGLLFCAFQANIADQFIPVQRMLDQGDALNEWTTAIGSAVFAIPPGFQEGGWIGEGLFAG
ncbi:Dyp-type peroxidase [Tessaracoccus massiliensis]|uniref:Dyp-type peroxidase n=1 Tax=Tessaracoccus massiliensis TaxID=1522311 RepID=UPI00059178C5|nr:Dyp-type peroxidase [Tessaracoccus massiliensis]